MSTQQWARRRDAEIGVVSTPYIPKAVNTLVAAVETDVRRKLGEAIFHLAGAATFADGLLAQRAEIGEAAAGVAIPDPAVIRQARSLLEELVND